MCRININPDFEAIKTSINIQFFIRIMIENVENVKRKKFKNFHEFCIQSFNFIAKRALITDSRVVFRYKMIPNGRSFSLL